MSRPTRSRSWTRGEIKKTLDDLTIYGRYVDGENWIEYHLPDGRTAYWEKGCTYPGKWWMEHGQVCYAYPNYHDNAANCFVLYRRPSGEIQFVAIADAGFAYLASFSLKTATGNDAALPIGSLSPCVGVAVARIASLRHDERQASTHDVQQ